MKYNLQIQSHCSSFGGKMNSSLNTPFSFLKGKYTHLLSIFKLFLGMNMVMSKVISFRFCYYVSLISCCCVISKHINIMSYHMVIWYFMGLWGITWSFDIKVSCAHNACIAISIRRIMCAIYNCANIDISEWTFLY